MSCLPRIQRRKTDLTGNVSYFCLRSLGLICIKTLMRCRLQEVSRNLENYYLLWSGDISFFQSFAAWQTYQCKYVVPPSLDTQLSIEYLILIRLSITVYLSSNTLLDVHFISNFHSGGTFGENLSYQRKLYLFSTCFIKCRGYIKAFVK